MSRTFFWIASLTIIALFALQHFGVIQLPSHTGNIVKHNQSSGKAAIGGEFTLTDQHGNSVSDTAFRDRLMLIFFGFTHCPNICPVDLAIMTEAVNLLEDTKEVAPIFITVDPERDTVEQMKSYIESFHPDFTALTGDKEAIEKVVSHYRVYSKKVDDDTMQGYMMDHSGFIYLMGRDGSFLTHFPHNTSPEEIANTIRTYL